MSFYVKTTLAVVAVVAVAVVVILWLTGSDERKIEKLLDDGVAAANRYDADALIALVSKNYKRRTEDYGAVCDRIRGVTRDKPYAKVELTGSTITVAGDAAEADIHIVIHAEGQKFPQRYLVTFAREGDRWLVTSFEGRELIQ